jgi:hypothetical protein
MMLNRKRKVFLDVQGNVFGWGKVKAGTIAFIYLLFGGFFLFVSIGIFIGIGRVDSSRTVSFLDIVALVNIAVSFLFLWFTLRFFKAELFGE